MATQFYKLGILTAATTVSLAFVPVAPANAAYFTFNFGYGGQGTLAFDVSPLRGTGTEIIRLSQLNDYHVNHNSLPPIFIYLYESVLPFGYNSADPERVSFDSFSEIDPLFTFQSGRLVGIDQVNANSAGFSFSEGRYGPPYYSGLGTVNFSFSGSWYEVFLSYETIVTDLVLVPVYDEDGNIIDLRHEDREVDRYYTPYLAYDTEAITFQTIEPVNGIPEPLTVLGVGTALSFGTWFKRALSKNPTDR